MKELAQDEKAMRETKAPTPDSPEELSEYIESLVDRTHDYGTCVYAMSLAATAAFNYVAHRLGVTGFQAGCADMDILRRTRYMEGPFAIVKGEDMLYPQYNIQRKVEGYLEDWKGWAKEQAAKKLEEDPDASPVVLEHWRRLAE